MEQIEKAIIENEKLIYKLAHYFSNYASIEDLYQAGCIGIIKGFPNYDKERNVKFSTYIYSYIIGEMKKLVRETSSIKISPGIISLKGKILKAKDKLTQTLMRPPTTNELCKYLQIDEYELMEALNSNIILESLDNNVKDTNLLFHEIISAPNINYDDLIYLKNIIESLKEPEKTIMIERYYNDLTQSEIAKKIGLNQVDISRKECKVLAKIKTYNWLLKTKKLYLY